MFQNLLIISLICPCLSVLHHLLIPFPVAYHNALFLALSFSTYMQRHQHSHLIPVIKSSPLCWWHPNNYSFCTGNCYHRSKSYQDTISDISSWMTSNRLYLNPSKPEFMLIGIPQQISKISNPSLSLPLYLPLTPTDSARNPGFIFD